MRNHDGQSRTMVDHAGRDGMSLPAAVVVGADTSITGTIRALGTVWVDGRVEGDICTDDLVVIGDGAVVIGNVSANSVICRGMLMGDIVAAEEVELMASASFHGTVRAPVLSVDDGALFNDNLESTCTVEDLPGDEKPSAYAA